MPWLETAPMEQRERFVRDHQLALYTMAELSARYGISRKTGYKWLDRFDEGGRDGLGDRSRAPLRSPGRQYGGGPPGAQGAGQEAPPASPLPTSRRGADPDRPPQ